MSYETFSKLTVCIVVLTVNDIRERVEIRELGVISGLIELFTEYHIAACVGA
jgi:succinate-acetate transporter protein